MNGGGRNCLFDGFNTACENIAASFLKVGDESMIAIRFRKTAKGQLTALIIYIPEDGAPGYRFQYSCLLCNRVLALHRSAKGEGRDEGQPLQARAWSHYGVYKADDGSNKGDRSEVYKRGAKVLFPV